MLSSLRNTFFAIVMLTLAGGIARAAVAPPFYSAVGTALTPEVGVVNTGILQDAKGIVSADHKYVTITMGGTSAGLLALQEFSFQQGGIAAADSNVDRLAAAQGAPMPVVVTILDRTGITRVD